MALPTDIGYTRAMRFGSTLCLGLFAVGLGASSAFAADLSGMWELQAIGQDGTSLQIEQKGDKVMIYRVMYPEFEGEKYKLEHLYRGNLIGKNLSGSLLVRDDPSAPFETLRPFDGLVKMDTYIVVDDLPLKLVKAGGGPLPVKVPEPKQRKKRGADTPPLSVAPTPEQPEHPQEKIATGSADSELLANVLGRPSNSLFEISARIRLPSPADDYQRLADEKLQQKQWAEAIELYDKALELDPKRLEVYSKLGTAHSELKQFEDARKYLRQALRFDPNNKALKKQLSRLAKG